jgi:hypothetical protein
MQKAGHWPCDEAEGEQQENRRETKPPRQPLSGHTEDKHAGQPDEEMFIHDAAP